jgi:hypothetical protein
VCACLGVACWQVPRLDQGEDYRLADSQLRRRLLGSEELEVVPHHLSA